MDIALLETRLQKQQGMEKKNWTNEHREKKEFKTVIKQDCIHEHPRQHIWQYTLRSKRIYNSSDLDT